MKKKVCARTSWTYYLEDERKCSQEKMQAVTRFSNRTYHCLRMELKYYNLLQIHSICHFGYNTCSFYSHQHYIVKLPKQHTGTELQITKGLKIISTELKNKVFDYYQTAYRDIIKCGGESWSLSSELTYTQITIALLIVINILTNY